MTACWRVMMVEIINTGSELLLGRTLNTHQQWLCRELSDLGYDVSRQVAVADTREMICGAVRESLSRVQIVIVTGGLGPTSDDLTREGIAELLGLELREDPEIVNQLKALFRSRKRVMPERTRIQAMVPVGACVLPNTVGTAPGLAIELDPNPFSPGQQAILILLPGPPRELHPMFTDSVAPLLSERFPPSEPFVCRTLRTTGVPESMAQERIEQPLSSLVNQGLTVGYCARPGEVDIRLSSRGPSSASLVSQAETQVREAMGDSIYTGEEGEELEASVVRIFTERRFTLAVAESCTGGLIAHRLTNVPGASAVLLAGWVTYSNEAKQECLGVSEELLATHGAVSEPVARAMAEGARRKTGTDIAVAVTGIAGPGGGSREKPVGTVFIAVAEPKATTVVKHDNRWDRATFKQVTSQQALELVRRCALDLPLK